MGYQGYYYWFGNDENIKIIFADISQKLPFENSFFSLVVGLDFFHRFDQIHLLEELDRVTTKYGAMLFPHVHLTKFWSPLQILRTIRQTFDHTALQMSPLMRAVGRDSRRGTLWGGDIGWDTAHDVVEGEVSGLTLSVGERAWLLACWCAACSIQAGIS